MAAATLLLAPAALSRGAGAGAESEAGGGGAEEGAEPLLRRR
jgi:hypothetical protein